MASVLLGVHLPLGQFRPCRLPGVELSGKVQALKTAAAEKLGLQLPEFELMYCGNILTDEATLSSCGIKDGVMVHVLKKKQPDPPPKPREVSETELVQLVFAFRTMLLGSSFRSTMQKFSRPDVLENLKASTPGLAEDPVALAMVQDPELMSHMADMDTVKRLSELHPSLVEAANHFAASVHSEQQSGSGGASGSGGSAGGGANLTGYSYSLDALSDDDEMDSSQGSDSVRQGAGQAGGMITQAQLAAALAAATGSPSTSNSGSAALSRGRMITPEMVSNAMQQAVASISTTNVNSQVLSQAEAATRQLILSQLQQMRELGIVDDALSLRALEATDGDVQAAVELVFSGWIGEDPGSSNH